MYLLLVLLPFFGITQSDTLNQTDEEGKKQGYWIFYGKDRPEKGYPAEGKIEEGGYVNSRKEGQWIKYYRDGVTPKVIFHYINNRPDGTYEKRYQDGSVRESGNFTRGKYLGRRLSYFENGTIELSANYDSLGKEIDSTFYNFKNGCRKFVIIYSAPGVVSSSVRYKSDSCNVPLTTKVREPVLNPIEPVVNPVKPITGRATRITYKLLLEDDQYYIEEWTLSTMSGSEKNDKRLIPVRNIRMKPIPTGYNKLVNANDEIFIDGDFNNGHFLHGKVYIYDDDGILIKVKVYKKGIYHSDGQL